MTENSPKPALDPIEIVSRLMGVSERFADPADFKPGHVVRSSDGLIPSGQGRTDNSRFFVLLEVYPSFRKVSGNWQHPDSPIAYAAYLDPNGDVATCWISLWLYQVVQLSDYRDSLHG